MKKALKITGLILLVGFIIIQFFPVKKNVSDEGKTENDITSLYKVPPRIQEQLKVSCYDCHSNNTKYLWYDKIQPVGWYIEDHIKHGKHELNFNEFGTYSSRKRHHKLEKAAEEIEEGMMPLTSYTFMHRNAQLSDAEREELVAWFNKMAKQVEDK